MPAFYPTRKDRLPTDWEDRRFLWTCRGALRLTSLERDEALSRPVRFRLRLHRLLCKFCRRYALQLAFLGVALRRQLPSGPPLGREARKRLKDALNGR
jgi:hypothetical protein